MGADIDVSKVANEIGITETSSFQKSDSGLETAFGIMSGVASSFRKSFDSDILIPNTYKRSVDWR